MRKFKVVAAILSPAALLIASGCSAQSGDNAASATVGPFNVAPVASFDMPWAAAFAPGTQVLFVTEKKGTMKFIDLPSGRQGTVTGIPEVNFNGQGGFGDL